MNSTKTSDAEGAASAARASRRTGRADTTAQRILQAATELFLRDGYAKTNLERIAAAAGVTKPTVYSHFGSKNGLLQAVTEANAGKSLEGLYSTLQPTGRPQAELLLFSETFLAIVLSDKARLWRRLAAAESLDHPEVGAAFFQSGPAQVCMALADYFKHEKRAGRLTVAHPQRTAEQFIGTLLGLDLLRSYVGMSLDASDRRRHCVEAVDLFLAAHGNQPS